MSTTVTYKGSTLTTVDNQTRTLKTAGKYMEDDVVLTDVTAGGGGSVTQDQDGFIVLPSTSGGSPSVSGLEYETGTWTPSEDIDRPTITFTNQHSDIPMFVMMIDATGTDNQTQNTNYGFSYTAFNAFSNAVPSDITSNRRYGLASYVYRTSSNPAQAVSAATSTSGSTSSAEQYWVTASEFYPSSAATGRYWRTGRTYKWIAVWVPTT